MIPRPTEVEDQPEVPTPEEAERMVEALLFASAESLSRRDIDAALPEGCDTAAILESLKRRYEGRGVELRRAGSRWAFRTAEDLGWMFDREMTRERKLSRAALETLAIIAYHQPVTRAQIEEIRGVAVSRSTVHTLMELGWVGLGRRKQVPGRPVTFVITDGFLDHFGLASVRDLPGLAEIKELGLLARASEERGGSTSADGESGEGEADAADGLAEEDRASGDGREKLDESPGDETAEEEAASGDHGDPAEEEDTEGEDGETAEDLPVDEADDVPVDEDEVTESPEGEMENPSADDAKEETEPSA